MEYETSISAESEQKTTESDAKESNPGTHYNAMLAVAIMYNKHTHVCSCMVPL
jgi:hypothetical protein